MKKPVKILVLGGGGRENALCWKLAQSPVCEEIYCAPGNGGTASLDKVKNLDIDILDFNTVKKFCKDEPIDLVVVGPELPLSQSIVDVLEADGIRVFGPNRQGACLEWSKAYAKEFMENAGIPNAKFEVVDSLTKTEAVIKNHWARVIKVDGLAAGKGVFVCADEKEAQEAAEKIFKQRAFGDAGNKVVIEEKLSGDELSLLALCDGTNLVPMLASQDHKRRFENDRGPNTGGMGAYAPVELYKRHEKAIEEHVLNPIRKALKEGKLVFKGVLFIGLMISDKPYVLEFNTRFGDPETQTILPLLKSDLLEALWACTEKTLDKVKLEWSSNSSCCVCLVADNYPEGSSKGQRIEISSDIEDAVVFHAGTKLADGKLVTNGGRVLNVVGVAPTMSEAIAAAYNAIPSIKFTGMAYRRDIARRASACPSV
ncbi:MAG: phosphoribosylamine--glycine ligase [Candidatus Obscuribacterales bacterium]|nr:phosphoribosylamine--glycine ligase [Candidatus Obscuribacterales bacterium]